MTAKHDKKNFAKLFEFDDLGQVLFTLSSGDDGPEISYRISSVHNVELCIKLSGYGDNEDGWNRADQVFNSITAATAKEMGAALKTQFLKVVGKEYHNG